MRCVPFYDHVCYKYLKKAWENGDKGGIWVALILTIHISYVLVFGWLYRSKHP